MKPWTKEQIEEADYYGISLFNVDDTPMIGDHCEICHTIFIREVTETVFPRYCGKCILGNENLKLNELRENQ